MSETLSQELTRDPTCRVVGLVGTGHVDIRSAIPNRVERRCGIAPYSVVTRPVRFSGDQGVRMPEIDRPETCADLLWYTSRRRDIYA
jgi:hypothetical protein